MLQIYFIIFFLLPLYNAFSFFKVNTKLQKLQGFMTQYILKVTNLWCIAQSSNPFLQGYDVTGLWSCKKSIFITQTTCGLVLQGIQKALVDPEMKASVERQHR